MADEEVFVEEKERLPWWEPNCGPSLPRSICRWRSWSRKIMF